MSHRTKRFLCAFAVLLVPATVALGGPYDAAPAKIAHFHLSGPITETPQEDPFGLSGAHIKSFKDLLERLAKARKDDAVKAVVVTLENISMGAGQLEELRDALAKFDAVDKRVFVHVDNLNTFTLAMLASVSDLSLVPTADVWVNGIFIESLYLKGLLDKLGVQADILQMGDYKSAGEMLMRTGPSEPAKENVDWLLDGLYDSIVKMIAQARGMTEAQVGELIDHAPYSAEEALAKGLVDAVQYRDEFLGKIREVYGSDVAVDNRYGEKDLVSVDFSNPFAFFTMFAEMLTKGTKASGDSIGLVYVEGMILPGHGEPSPFGGSSGAFSGDISKALYQAAEDPSVKAVVLRVDSPGGSALASEIIWRATQIVRQKKPVVVSMGNVAGSGGYYVACGADFIYADQTTITASIGVVGGKMVTTGMWDKIGVNWVPYKRGANADILASDERFTPEQREHIQRWMNNIYGVFKNHVVQGRGDKLAKPIDELAGGRVYTGGQAVELGLVDKIGGLSDAVEHAARMASIGEYELRVIPESKNFLDVLMTELTGKGERPSDISVRALPLMFRDNGSMLDVILPLLHELDPARARAVFQALQRIELLHRESVITAMPQEFIIR